MTMNKSLRVRKGGGGSRGVLSRAERIVKLKELEKWQDGQSPLGLPKVRVYKISMKKKKTSKTDDEVAKK
jgi:small basic protein (TIGR04137 family)